MLHDLADAIWRQHYGKIISTAQIDYMLAGRMSDDSLRNYVQTPDRWLEVLRAAGFEVVGEALFDIGSGFVMDDYVMAKRLGAE